MLQRIICLRLRGVVTMGYSWLITAHCNYFCCQQVEASMEREAVGGGYNNPVRGFFLVSVRVVLP